MHHRSRRVWSGWRLRPPITCSRSWPAWDPRSRPPARGRGAGGATSPTATGAPGTCTTSDLARRLGIAPATASHHVGVLRDAKLVASSRTGNAVNHRLTDLGTALLNGHR
jgi:DNA-binding transcriptional ArsR family regulator